MGLEAVVMAEEGSAEEGSAAMAREAAEKEAAVGQWAARATEGWQRAGRVTLTQSATGWTV